MTESNSEIVALVTSTAKRIWLAALDSWDLNVDLDKDEVITYHSAWEKEFIERVEEELRALLRKLSGEGAPATAERCRVVEVRHASWCSSSQAERRSCKAHVGGSSPPTSLGEEVRSMR